MRMCGNIQIKINFNSLWISILFFNVERFAQSIKKLQEFRKKRDKERKTEREEERKREREREIFPSTSYSLVDVITWRFPRDRPAGSRDLARVITYNNSYLIARNQVSYVTSQVELARAPPRRPRRRQKRCCHCCPLRTVPTRYCARNFIVRPG